MIGSNKEKKKERIISMFDDMTDDFFEDDLFEDGDALVENDIDDDIEALIFNDNPYAQAENDMLGIF